MVDDSNNQSTGNAALASETVSPPAKKRAVLRCALVASVEVIDENSQTQISARTSEIGLGGCYVDTLNPFPEGSLVRVRIVRDGGTFESDAKVVYVHDNFGMGLAFTSIAVDQRRLLQNWIAALVTKLTPAT